MSMGKKLLLILSALAVVGYIFRDRVATAAVVLFDKANGVFAEDDTEDDDLSPLYPMSKEN